MRKNNKNNNQEAEEKGEKKVRVALKGSTRLKNIPRSNQFFRGFFFVNRNSN